MTLEEFDASWRKLFDRLGASIGPPRTTIHRTPGSIGGQLRRQREGHSPATIACWLEETVRAAYVETFGQQWLADLPDSAQVMRDGSVSHALDAQLSDVVRGNDDAYERVWPYLKRAGVKPAWPRRLVELRAEHCVRPKLTRS